uniref:Uncharacterized protein n=1 Tax=Lactuca sativa TaxID=4236 RepID=A0A9R1W0Q1_LACSA|nr:hypothetical protein LSAT_V11C300142830 [Lactuca sativa]
MYVISLYPVICEVLDKIGEVSACSYGRLKADVVGNALEIFGVTKYLNNVLQRKDQDVVNAMSFVTLTKQHLQKIRDNRCELLLSSIIAFCETNSIENVYVSRGRKKRDKLNTTNFHNF